MPDRCLRQSNRSPWLHCVLLLYLGLSSLLCLSASESGETFSPLALSEDSASGIEPAEPFVLPLMDTLQLKAAREAYEMGSVHVAKLLYSSEYERLKEISSIALPYKKRILETICLDLASIHIALNELDAADAWLQSCPWPSAATSLRKAMISFLRQEPYLSFFNEVSSEALCASDKEWYLIFKGLIESTRPGSYESKGGIEGGLSEASARQLDLMRFRLNLNQEQADERVYLELKQRWKQYQSQGSPELFAKEYAIAAHKQGFSQDALKVLKQAKESASSDLIKDEFQLLAILIREEMGAPVTDHWIEFARHAHSERLRRMALHALMAGEVTQSLVALVEELVSDPSLAAFKDNLYWMHAHLSFELGRLDRAQERAQALLDAFPGSSLKASAFNLLCQVALARQPAQYRLAAHYLSELRGLVDASNPTQQQTLSVLIGDCYFANEDYDYALQHYQCVMDAEMAPQYLSAYALSQKILSHIKLKNWDNAQDLLESESAQMDPRQRFDLEWNFIQEMDFCGEENRALTHLVSLTQQSDQFPLELYLRLLYEQVNLGVQLGDLDDAQQLIEEMRARIDQAPERDSEAMIHMRAHILLKCIEIHLAREEIPQAQDELKRLQEALPDVLATQKAYFVCARALSEKGYLSQAQQTWTAFVDAYPSSPYAAQALFEAAASLSQASHEQAPTQAYRLLERLTEDYSESPFCFNAEMKKGELLRQLNEFPSAVRLYRKICERYAHYPDGPKAELALADSLVGLETKESEQEALSILESLYERISSPAGIKIESMYKSAFIHLKNKHFKEAIALHVHLLNEHLLGATQRKLMPKSRYWLERSAGDLQQLLSQQNIDEAERYQLKELLAQGFARLGRHSQPN